MAQLDRELTVLVGELDRVAVANELGKRLMEQLNQPLTGVNRENTDDDSGSGGGAHGRGAAAPRHILPARAPLRHPHPHTRPRRLSGARAAAQPLQRLYRIVPTQLDYRDDRRFFSFRSAWQLAVGSGDLAITSSVNAQPDLRGNTSFSFDTLLAIQCVFATRDFAFAMWFFATRPEYISEISTVNLLVLTSWGDLRMVQWVEQHAPHIEWTTDVMDSAAQKGNLPLTEYLHTHRHEGGSMHAMDYPMHHRRDGQRDTAMHGRLEIVQFLHEHRTEGCTKQAMDAAVANGHVEVVKFLHEHRREGCMTEAMDQAATVEIVGFLHHNSAAQEARLDIVRFLHEHRSEGCTSAAMDAAAMNEHVDLVTFLHENRHEGSSSHAITSAVVRGHLPVVQFLHETRRWGRAW